MTQFTDARPACAPPPNRGAQRLLRLVCTSNPFYVLSAGLFLAGLYGSFEAQADEVQTWALMSGLTGYTLLLAVTACLLVRFGRVWDDVRTVLLLVVLMFLSTSVTFDELLVMNWKRGLACCLAGLLVAVFVSEGMLRGTRLILPVWFRAPYYLILALFFLYPLLISSQLANPHSEELMWALYGFSPAAGLVFLTLLPAIRRGADCVRDNGSPWRWPLYPWVLFGLLGFAVPARAFLLCWSMHLLDSDDRDRLIFGPYFLIPFGLAVGVLLLELALITHRAWVRRTALAVPVGLVVLALLGHRSDPIYRGFLETFTARAGDPLTLTLLASAAFYAFAAWRGMAAVAPLTLTLLALSMVGQETLNSGDFSSPRPWPILAAAVVQLGLGLAHRNPWRCLVGGCCLAGGATAALPPHLIFLQELIAFHLVLLVVLVVGAAFNDGLGYVLRVLGGGLVVLACLTAVFAPIDLTATFPSLLIEAYPAALAGLLAAYALLLDHRLLLRFAAVSLAPWLLAVVWRGYALVRQVVAGLDCITLSLALFAVAVLISLGKAGLLSRWLRTWGMIDPPDEPGERPKTGIQREVRAPLIGQEIQLPAVGEIQPE